MFTGLVESTGTVLSLEARGDQARLTLDIPFASELELGESVAINGCCLTVVAITTEGWLEFQAGTETLSKTNLGELQAGSPVNLERSVTPQTRLGGHMVQGHVDTEVGLQEGNVLQAVIDGVDLIHQVATHKADEVSLAVILWITKWKVTCSFFI